VPAGNEYGSGDEDATVADGSADLLAGLWIDDPEQVAARRGAIPEALRSHFDEFVDKGYTIFRGALPTELIDRVVADMGGFDVHPERYVLKYQGAYIDPVGHGDLRVGDRIVDLYGLSSAARDAIYAAPVADFLQLIFDDAAIAMQSISFQYGSQQSMHQDTAYVVSERPLHLAATWIALEDIIEGTGELMYYPGSHRYAHYLFSGEHKNWMPTRDGQEAHQQFLQQLHTQAKERGLVAERFLAKKGDILVWHADLAHGGARISKPGVTRKSLVTHFCPRPVKPVYRRHIPKNYFELEVKPGCFFTSRHYDIATLKKGGEFAPILYDGGVSKKRAAAKSAGV